jgi:hypothetical protein
MIIGYARVSTDGQTLDAQHAALIAAGAEKVFAEKVSGAVTARKALTKTAWFAPGQGCYVCHRGADVLAAALGEIWPAPTAARTADYPRKEPLGLRDSLPRCLRGSRAFAAQPLYELLSSYIFDLFNLLVRAADDYLLVPTRLLIQPMIGHRISSGVSDRGQKLVVAASRKGEHVVAPPTPKLVGAFAATMGVVAAPALNHMPARPSAVPSWHGSRGPTPHSSNKLSRGSAPIRRNAPPSFANHSRRHRCSGNVHL